MFNELPLSSEQLDTLKDDFVELQIDSMDMQCLLELASDCPRDSYDKLSQTEIKERIDSLYSEETFYEMVDNILSTPNDDYKLIPTRY